MLIGLTPSFPGPEGGLWQGVNLRLHGGLYGGFDVNEDAHMAALNVAEGTLDAGWELLHLGRANESFDQHGIGVFVGLRLGLQFTMLFSSPPLSGIDPTVGFAASLEIPRLSGETGHLRRMTIDFAYWTLPGTDTGFVTLGAGVVL
jgi:hypothetical protein